MWILQSFADEKRASEAVDEAQRDHLKSLLKEARENG